MNECKQIKSANAGPRCYCSGMFALQPFAELCMHIFHLATGYVFIFFLCRKPLGNVISYILRFKLSAQPTKILKSPND